MLTQNLSFSICVLSFVAISLLPGGAPKTLPQQELRQFMDQHTDSEALLAVGERLRFSECGLFDLELIPGLSDRLAGELIRKKGEIYAASRLMAPERRAQAFMLVRGIGPKTAQKLDLYLRID